MIHQPENQTRMRAGQRLTIQKHLARRAALRDPRITRTILAGICVSDADKENMAHLTQLAEVPQEQDPHQGLPDWYLAALVATLQERRSRLVWVMPIQWESETWTNGVQ